MTIVRLVVPPKVRKPGRYTVVWRATSDGASVSRRITVQIAAGTKARAAAGNCNTVVGVLLNGARLPRQVTGHLRSTTRLIPATTQALLSTIASPTRNVQVVVIDLDRLGVQPINDIRLVYPNIRILALSRDATLRASASKAGATTTLAPTDPRVGRTIESLAHRGCAAPATKPKTQHLTPTPLPKSGVTLQKKLDAVLARRTIQFQPGSAVLAAGGRTTLDNLLRTLRPYPNARIRIEGYTDSDGTSGQNLDLSRARASTVRGYLVAHGVEASNLTAIGFGENRPVASNSTPAGKAKNRRIELRVTWTRA
jgi:outer membrane protein OmpA-like peptidoglycan-associated protein